MPYFAKTRHHGDYHLGQVLAVSGDAIIVDLDGRADATARGKRRAPWVLRDVAGTPRSLAYAEAAASRDVTDPAARQAPLRGRSNCRVGVSRRLTWLLQGAPGWPPSRPTRTDRALLHAGEGAFIR